MKRQKDVVGGVLSEQNILRSLQADNASAPMLRTVLENLLKAHKELSEFKHTDSDYLFEQLMDAVIKATDEANDAIGKNNE